MLFWLLGNLDIKLILPPQKKKNITLIYEFPSHKPPEIHFAPGKIKNKIVKLPSTCRTSKSIEWLPSWLFILADLGWLSYKNDEVMRIKQRTFPLKLKLRNSRIMRQSVRPQKQVQGLNHSQTDSNCQIDCDWKMKLKWWNSKSGKKFCCCWGGGGLLRVVLCGRMCGGWGFNLCT